MGLRLGPGLGTSGCLPAARFACALLLLLAVPASAQPTLEARLRGAIAERWGLDAAAVALEFSAPDVASALPADATFRLLDGGDDGVWYVDVDGAAGTERVRLRAGTETAVPVAARDLERGAVLAADDIATERTVRWGPPSRDGTAVETGWETRRRIRQGEPLAAPAVSAPQVVKAGDAVRIVYARGPVQLALAGKAAGSGAVGERVAVRAETGKRLEGTVTAPGTVTIGTGAAARR